MVLFTIRTRKNKNVISWLKDMREKSKSEDLYKNPFNIRTALKQESTGFLIIFDIQPVYFCYPLFAWVSLVLLYFWIGLSYILLPFLFFGLCGFFWTKYFYYFMVRLALRKAKYTGKIMLVSNKTALNEVVFN